MVKNLNIECDLGLELMLAKCLIHASYVLILVKIRK